MMKPMKAHVLYDSAYGNTRQIAETIAAVLKPLQARAVSVGDFDPGSLAAGDLLIVGSPINGWKPTGKIIELLQALTARGLDGVKAATFDTRVKLFIHGDAAKKMTSQLKKAGALIISKPMPFYVKGTEGPLKSGETQKAAAWALGILQSAGQTGSASSGKGH
jgi:flavodoxin